MESLMRCGWRGVLEFGGGVVVVQNSGAGGVITHYTTKKTRTGTQ